MARIRDPSRYAREGMWERFNKRAGPFTKFVTDHNPERTRLLLENSAWIQVAAWMSDLESNVSVLYKMQNDTWMLYTHWREVDDVSIDGAIAYAVVSSSSLDSLASAVSLLEFPDQDEVNWFANRTREDE